MRDALFHVPRGYWVRGPIGSIAAAIAATDRDAVVIEGVVRSSRSSGRGRRSHARLKVEDSSGKVEAWFFNQGYLSKSVRRGARIWISGRIDRTGSEPRLFADRHGVIRGKAPEEGAAGPLRIARYDLPDEVPAATWRRAIAAALCEVEGAHESSSTMTPASVMDGSDPEWMPLLSALREVHLPTSDDEAAFQLARRRIAYEELLAIATALRRSRHRARGTTRPGLVGDKQNNAAALLGRLPFLATGAQEGAVRQILDDLAAPRPMHRLLQGDVGSGKTAVARCALLAVALAGHRAAMLVPTTLLARQHADSLAAGFAEVGVPLTVITGGGRERRVEGRPDRGHVFLGTHALLGEKADLGDVRLAVIDEQHRFGVSQRARLRDTGVSTDLLVMTATPIPRSLLLTLYGDLDVTVLDESPPGRGAVQTRVVDQGELLGLMDEMDREARGGGRVFVVCPRIEDKGDDGVPSAKAIARELARRFRGGPGVALVHGKQKEEVNAAALARFRTGEATVLVATVMIEVGLDVPSATMMVVLDAERFGLATLHQLRGRVGRGSAASICRLVLGEGAKESSRQRLEVLARTTDGLQIAEADLALRGPGAAFGQNQHGRLALRCAQIPRDLDLVGRARDAAARSEVVHAGDHASPLRWPQTEGEVGPG